MKIEKTRWKIRQRYLLRECDAMFKLYFINTTTAGEYLTRNFLHEDEIQEALAFGSRLYRNRLIAVRGLLRKILTERLGVPAGNIRFDRSENGKMFLAFPKVSVFFSVSHSRSDSIIAVSDRNIGIDMELIRDIDYLPIAEYCFSPAERRLCKNSDDFLRLWTRREALVKLYGESLLSYMNIDVAGAAGGTPLFLRTHKVKDYVVSVAMESCEFSREAIYDNRR